MTDIDRSDRKRLEKSLLISCLLWLAAALLVVFMPARHAETQPIRFREVRMTLVPAVPEPKPVSSVAAAIRSLPRELKEPAGNTVIAAPAEKAGAQKQSPGQNKAAAPAAPSRPRPAARTEAASQGLGIPNFSTPVASGAASSDSPEYLDFSSPKESESSAVPSSATLPELEGKAASVTSAATGGARVAGSGGKNGSRTSDSASPSAATGTKLGEIASSVNASVPASGSVSAVSRPGSSSSTAPASGGQQSAASPVTGLSFDGTPRRLLNPANPAIELPDSLKQLVDSNRKVTVAFTVHPDGTVPSGSVSFSPSGVLPAEIQDYLRSEFSRWLFEKSGEDGQARFSYSIRVK